MYIAKNRLKCIAGLGAAVCFFQTVSFAQFQNMKPVDVNNDGRMDLIDVYNHDGTAEIRVRLSTPDGFKTENWTGDGQGIYREQFNWFTGDFDGDGQTDLGKVWAADGKLKSDVHLNTGSGFSIQSWTDAQGEFKYNQRWFAGDYTGDGKDDLLKLWNDGGLISMDVLQAGSGSFTQVKKVTQTGATSPAMDFFSGDFNGDGALDIMKVWQDKKAYSFEAIHGKTFTAASYAVKQGSFGLLNKWLIGDFNGDGKDDMARLRGENFDIHQGGQTRIEVHVSDGESFDLQVWGQGLGDYGRDCDYRHFATGDFDGDGDDDIVQLWNDGGKLSVDLYRSSGSSFSRERLMTKTSDWFRKKRWLVSDFDGDGITDLGAVWDNAGTITFEVFVCDGDALSYQVWGEEKEAGYYDRRWFGGVIESDNSSANKICVSIPSFAVSQIQTVLNDGLDIYLERGGEYLVDGLWSYMADGQRIETEDVLRLEDFATVIAGSRDSARVIDSWGRSYTTLRHVMVDGNRYTTAFDFNYNKDVYLLSTLGFGQGSHQLVDRVVAQSTRAWSTIQVHEENNADWNVVQNMIINGAGPGPRGGGITPGEDPLQNWNKKAAMWADGISNGAENSLIRNNLIIDPTDVGIVIFGAPGTLVENNCIAMVTRDGLAAINMVDGIDKFDMGGWHDYRNVVVRNNVIDAWGGRMMNGICMGRGRWGCGKMGDFRGPVVVDNHFTGNCFGWGIPYGDFTDAVIDRNTSDASHNGDPDSRCDEVTNEAVFCTAASGTFTWATIDSWALPNGRTYGRSALDTPDGSKYCFAYHGTGMDGAATQTIELSPNTKYRLSVWVKLLPGTTGPAYITVQDLPSAEIKVKTGETHWICKERTFNSGSRNSITLQIFGGAEFGSGSLYVDHLSLVSIKDADRNLIANSDFEAGGGSSLQREFETTAETGGNLERLLWMTGVANEADGYYDYTYTEVEARAVINAATVEILGREPDAAEVETQLPRLMSDRLSGDEFRIELMQSKEFTSAHPGITGKNLHPFRLNRWKDRFIEIDNHALDESGNYSRATKLFRQTTGLLATPSTHLPPAAATPVPPKGDKAVLLDHHPIRKLLRLLFGR